MIGLFLNNRTLLHSPSRPATHGENLSAEITHMLMIMGHHNGIGLAANQIGLNKRIIIIRTQSFKQVFINPEITRTRGRLVPSIEGCLSYPGLQIKKWRTPQIFVEGFDENWKPIRRKLKSLSAFVVQHEIDHLNGVTIRD